MNPVTIVVLKREERRSLELLRRGGGVSVHIPALLSASKVAADEDEQFNARAESVTAGGIQARIDDLVAIAERRFKFRALSL